MNTTNRSTLSRYARALGTLLLLGSSVRSPAPPPLVTGDVPTADKGTFEWYVGLAYEDSGSIERALPHTELVYGWAANWEISIETDLLSTEGHHGLGDIGLATKYCVLTETEQRPGVSFAADVGLPTGDEDKGLGAGATDFSLEARVQKTFGFFTPMLNLGYVWQQEPTIGGVHQDRRDYVTAAFGQAWQLTEHAYLLSEIYGHGKDEPGGEDEVAAQIGFKYEFSESFQVHGAVGRSLRNHAKGGPDLRVYLGCEIGFDAPWTKK
ncbi:MAG: transporter [Verrucomicrobiota bacterium]